jgi:pilus assembly protein CpaF
MNDINSDVWGLVDYYIQPLKKYFSMEGVTDIFVDQYDKIFVVQFGKKKRIDEKFQSEEAVKTLITQIANALGQVVDSETHPILDARLPDGTRVHAVLYPTSILGSIIVFRLFPKVRLTSKNLTDTGSLTFGMLEYLRAAVITKRNMLISGSTGSGKTTLLNILSSFIPEKERVITAEDTQELQIDVDDRVMLEAPRRRQDGKRQEITLSSLIEATLRGTPDRVLVGEIRDYRAAIAFLEALNTGHDGTCSTVHANSCVHSLYRIQTLAGAEGNLPVTMIKDLVMQSLNILIHAQKTPNHGRRVVEIMEVVEGEVLLLWDFDYIKGRHNFYRENLKQSKILQNVEKYGFVINEIIN